MMKAVRIHDCAPREVLCYEVAFNQQFGDSTPALRSACCGDRLLR
jgi:hypothetical protein